MTAVPTADERTHTCRRLGGQGGQPRVRHSAQGCYKSDTSGSHVLAVTRLSRRRTADTAATGRLVLNTELGHLHLHRGDAEDWAAASIRERDDLSWREYAHRREVYLDLVQRLFWPELIIIGGGVSKSRKSSCHT